jgi:hypothetical protein
MNGCSKMTIVWHFLLKVNRAIDKKGMLSRKQSNIKAILIITKKIEHEQLLYYLFFQEIDILKNIFGMFFNPIRKVKPKNDERKFVLKPNEVHK